MNKYQVIYVDPPWHFHQNIDKAAQSIKTDNGQKSFVANNQYSTMSTEELKNLEINPYQVIYADPPWSYSGFALCEGNRKDYKKRLKTGEVKHHYTGMSTEELKNLGIEPYQVIYSDPPWHYNRDFEKELKNMGIGFNNVNKHYGDMSTEELKNLGIDPYQVVYSDPPWQYHLDIDKRTESIKIDNGQKGLSVRRQYSTMPPEEISALPIKDIVAKDAACFMWTTDTHLPYAIEIMKSWGFQYKTIAFVWIKKTVNNKQIHMLAPWTLKGAEICLLGTRGGMTKHKAVNNVHQVHEAVRREHSRKPDKIRDEIARMFPDCRRIELFARTAMPGWDAWGNEVEKFTEPENVVKSGALF